MMDIDEIRRNADAFFGLNHEGMRKLYIETLDKAESIYQNMQRAFRENSYDKLNSLAMQMQKTLDVKIHEEFQELRSRRYFSLFLHDMGTPTQILTLLSPKTLKMEAKAQRALDLMQYIIQDSIDLLRGYERQGCNVHNTLLQLLTVFCEDREKSEIAQTQGEHVLIRNIPKICKYEDFLITLEYDFYQDLPLAVVPKTLVSSITGNCLENAKKATYNQYQKDKQFTGHIHLGTAVDNSCIVVKVQDNGVGMSEKFIKEHLFGYGISGFHHQGLGGQGKGMHECAELLRQYGGSMHVESIEGKGSTFSTYYPKKEN